MATLGQARCEKFERDVADANDGTQAFARAARRLAVVVTLGGLAWAVVLAPIILFA